MKSPLPLCWFCGLRSPWAGVVRGMSLAEVTYGSGVRWALSCSESCSEETPGVQARRREHFDTASAAICHTCIRQRMKKLSPRSLTDVARLRHEYDLFLNETADYDTELIEWKERRWLPRCWFHNYPDINGKAEAFSSLTLAELCNRGWRPKGSTCFDLPALESLANRFSPETGAKPDGGSIECLKELAGTGNPGLLAKLGNARACILGITIQEMAAELSLDG